MHKTAILLQTSIGGIKGAREGNKGAGEGKKGAAPFYFCVAGTLGKFRNNLNEWTDGVTPKYLPKVDLYKSWSCEENFHANLQWYIIDFSMVMDFGSKF